MAARDDDGGQDTVLHARSSIEQGIEAYIRHLERERNCAVNTLEAYRRDLVQFTRFLYPRSSGMRLPLNSIQHDAVDDFVRELEARGLRSSSVVRKLASVRGMFRFLCRQRVLAANPAAVVGGERPEKKPPALLNVDEVERLIGQPAAEGFSGGRDRAILEIFYGGGICLAELVGLNLSALDTAEGTVRVVGQGRRERVVPIGAEALKTLRAYLQVRAELLLDLKITQVEAGALFLNSRGRRLHRRTVQRLVKRYIDQVSQGAGHSPHLLRHSFAAHLLDAGADLGAVRQLLGHATAAATQTYAKPSTERLRHIYQQAHPRSD
jgi:site-specific recombinase XerD